MNETTIDVDGVGVAIAEEGDPSARPLVFLHGGSRTLADWLFVTPQLQDFRLIGVDFRGHGKSEPVDTFGFLDGVADCRGVVEGLDLQDPVIIGHSLGGMTAIRYAAEGGRCAGIVNVDGFGTGHPSEFPGYSEEESIEKLNGFAAQSEEEFLKHEDTGDQAWLDGAIAGYRKGIEAMGLTWEEAEPLVMRGYRQLPDGRWQTSPTGAINASMYRSLYMHNHWLDYAKLTMPTLVIRSTREDSDYDEDTMKFLAALSIGLREKLDAWQSEAPAHRTVELFETGHMVMWEKPTELAASIRQFVESL